jgi:hypothetical protein
MFYHHYHQLFDASDTLKVWERETEETKRGRKEAGKTTRNEIKSRKHIHTRIPPFLFSFPVFSSTTLLNLPFSLFPSPRHTDFLHSQDGTTLFFFPHYFSFFVSFFLLVITEQQKKLFFLPFVSSFCFFFFLLSVCLVMMPFFFD